MPNVGVQTAPADDAFHVELPSAATTYSPPAADDSAQMGSADPSNGSAEMFVDNSCCAGLKFLCYISLVNMARMSSSRAQGGDVVRLFASDSSPKQVRPVRADGQACGLTDPMLLDAEHCGAVLVRGHTGRPVKTVHAASLRQDPVMKSASLIERNW
ncbi:unnamed protein product [Macrosiphum euphorbiae]|uniref:Uncharacterized protein n=1 Tax=Macrosiphum euphorbiae TaxID=13131 RepID=A0AAV0W6I9_9HEMI|nr:unnamed protein product [Macrosiphum euphorbiae]